MTKRFEIEALRDLYQPDLNSNGEDNGQIVIIGGSKLFHGAPILSLTAASRIVDMVFFSSPEKSMQEVATSIKGQLSSFIWVSWEEVKDYLQKVDSILIGPGLMRYKSEQASHGDEFHYCDEACELTTKITKYLLENFRDKKWVIDAGSLQVMQPSWIPKGAILTPNKKEYKMLFGDVSPNQAAKAYECIIVLKGPTTIVASGDDLYEVEGGNPGLTKGGTGDVQAGLTVALLAKNEPLIASLAGSFITKAAADELYKTQGFFYNADDLALQIPKTLKRYLEY